jgi:hypothetical protein
VGPRCDGPETAQEMILWVSWGQTPAHDLAQVIRAHGDRRARDQTMANGPRSLATRIHSGHRSVAISGRQEGERALLERDTDLAGFVLDDVYALVVVQRLLATCLDVAGRRFYRTGSSVTMPSRHDM